MKKAGQNCVQFLNNYENEQLRIESCGTCGALDRFTPSVSLTAASSLV